jgi:hypothetical protein
MKKVINYCLLATIVGFASCSGSLRVDAKIHPVGHMLTLNGLPFTGGRTEFLGHYKTHSITQPLDTLSMILGATPTGVRFRGRRGPKQITLTLFKKQTEGDYIGYWMPAKNNELSLVHY